MRPNGANARTRKKPRNPQNIRCRVFALSVAAEEAVCFYERVLASLATLALADAYCGRTLLVPRIFSRCTPGGLCKSAVN